MSCHRLQVCNMKPVYSLGKTKVQILYPLNQNPFSGNHLRYGKDFFLIFTKDCHWPKPMLILKPTLLNSIVLFNQTSNLPLTSRICF